MKITRIEKTGIATLRVQVNETLPNGQNYIEFFPHYNRKNQLAVYEAAQQVIALLEGQGNEKEDAHADL